jgi:hypothetical protein
MADAPTPQPASGENRVPAFLCPVCGYWCATTWETKSAKATGALFYERGKILVAIARMMPLCTVCIHPDGTSRYGGAETAPMPGRGTPPLLTPDTAEELLAPGHCSVDIVLSKRLEDALLLALAGPIAANLHCAVNPQDYPQEFAYAYDRLLDLPDTSPLVTHENDLRLSAIQQLVIDLLDAADEDLRRALLEGLAQRHVLTPAEMQALMENPGQVSDNAPDQR